MAGSWCYVNEPIAKKIAAMREKLNIPLSKCPCDPMSQDRGCIGKQCMKELIEQGDCHCHCFGRSWLNRQELEALFKFYDKDIKDFDKWFDGQTGGVLIDDQGNSVFYYYPWDVDRYLYNCCNIVTSINTPLVLLAQKIIKEKQGEAPKANGTQDNSELPLSP